MESLSLIDFAGRLGGALLLGSLIGLERERKHRPAGFRTMILISLGSAGFMLLGHEAIRAASEAARADAAANPGVPLAPIGSADVSRIIQGLIGGIGFLGAGAVIQNKKAVRGLTTAAAVWCTSAVGASCGLGFFRLAAMLAAACLFTLIVLELVEDKYFPDGDEERDRAGDEIRIVLDRDGRPMGPKG
jgi:putative Mg2+ transporter-C (MgtC) family protein